MLLARLCIVAWVGAAVLFVVTAVIEQSSDKFDSLIRDHLAVVRFPPYYLFGSVLVGVSLACGVAARKHSGLGRLKGLLFIALTLAALLLMVADYFFIYRPMVDMLTPVGKARPAEFGGYHDASKYINLVSITICLVAGGVICWPGRSRD